MSATEHAHAPYQIDEAQLADVPQIYALLRDYSTQEILLPRSEGDIYRSLRDFLVIREENRVIACGSLMIFTAELGEIRSLAVSPDSKNSGLGKCMVIHIEQQARRLGLQKLMALTYVEGFFRKLGYHVVDMSELPEKVWGACINCPKFTNCDEIAMLKYLQI